MGTLAASVIQSLFLSFTDFGIPASVGGRTEVIAGRLYNEMLGSVPNFNRGAVVAIMMLLPSIISILCVTAIFAVIIIVPFIEEWPYRVNFTLSHFTAVFEDTALSMVVRNSIVTAVLTALLGSLVVYGAALVTARSKISSKCKKVIESVALVTNTIPGMVLGIAFLLTFSGTSLQNTIVIIIFCNIIHFFSTPYLMMKSSFEKMN